VSPNEYSVQPLSSSSSQNIYIYIYLAVSFIYTRSRARGGVEWDNAQKSKLCRGVAWRHSLGPQGFPLATYDAGYLPAGARRPGVIIARNIAQLVSFHPSLACSVCMHGSANILRVQLHTFECEGAHAGGH
jgi:hypothetical protein